MTHRLLGLRSRKMKLPATDRANLEFGVRVEGQVLGRVPGAQFFTLPIGDGLPNWQSDVMSLEFGEEVGAGEQLCGRKL